MGHSIRMQKYFGIKKSQQYAGRSGKRNEVYAATTKVDLSMPASSFCCIQFGVRPRPVHVSSEFSGLRYLTGTTTRGFATAAGFVLPEAGMPAISSKTGMPTDSAIA